MNRPLPRMLCSLLLLSTLAAVWAAAAAAPGSTLLVKLKTPLLPLADAKGLQKSSVLPLGDWTGRPEIADWHPFVETGTSLTRAGAEAAAARAELGKWLLITLSAGTDPNALLPALRAAPQVASAAINRPFHPDWLPDDPLISRQYALNKVAAAAGWEIERGRSSVVVGVIDTGIDYTHPDLTANLWINPGEDLNGNGRADSLDYNGIDDDGNGFVDDVQGWDFTDAPNYPDGGDYRERDNNPMDEMGHGTAVAGIIAATANNSLGIAGLAPGCRLMNLRAFTAAGNGEEDDVAAALLYAIDNGAAVVNMSWGDVFISQLLDDVLHYAAAMQVVLVASAGNSATDAIHYPSAFACTISVGATDATDQLASFSNYGPSVDLVAPGVNILTTVRHALYDSSLSGTSFSAPFVSAAAALLLSQDGSRSPDAVRSILTTTADDLGLQGWDVYYGAGRLNLARALAPQIESAVRIRAPWLDEGFRKGPIEIYGSAWTSSLRSYALEWGMGDNPAAWSPVAAPQTSRVLDGLLGVWTNPPARDTSFTLRLRVQNHNGTLEQSQVRIFIDQSPPVLSRIALLGLYDAEYPAALLQFDTDDLCEGAVLYRRAGSSDSWQEEPMGYRTRQSRFLVSREMAAMPLELQVRAANTAGLQTTGDTLLQADPGQPPLNTMRYTRLGASLPHGHLLDRTADFDGDGRPEIILGYEENPNRLVTALFSQDGVGGLRQLLALQEPAIPRSIGDSDGDGRLELLTGYGFTTWLYEVNGIAPLSLSLVRKWQGDSNLQYWGSRLADLDGDKRGELIMRVVRSGSNASDDFEVWRCTSKGEFTPIAVLSNPSRGDNFYGVPHCETGDFDGDGRSEILLGDSDGDLFIYEMDGNRFTLTWQERLPLLDAVDFIAAGDFEGDGDPEFAAGCHSDPDLNTEHTYDSRHWCYRIYDKRGDNDYGVAAEWRFFGYESSKDFESGVSSGDSDGDGRDELFMAVYPDLYLAEYTPEGGYALSFHTATVQANAVTVVDSDGDSLRECWFSDGKAIHPWVLVENLSAPAMPVGLLARPFDATRVDLSWSAVPGAQAYLLYRGPAEDRLALFARVLQPAFRDSLVQPGVRYHYAVAAEDSARTPAVSLRSAVVAARPGVRPALLSAAVTGERTLHLRFSTAMDAGMLQNSRNYLITPEVGHPNTALPLASGGGVLLNLAAPLPAGRYRVEVRQVADLDGLPIDTTRAGCVFSVSAPASTPYLSNVSAPARGIVELTFNEPMEKSGLEARDNYNPGTGLYVAWAEAIAPDNRSVRLHITGSVAWGAVGKPLTIKVSGLRSAAGVALVPGRGDVIQLLFTARTLDAVHTFPNPYRMGVDPEGITFADLPAECEIRILTIAGQTVRLLNEENGDGGLVWDGRDEAGRLVPGGIYLYRVTAGGKDHLGKLAVVR